MCQGLRAIQTSTARLATLFGNTAIDTSLHSPMNVASLRRTDQVAPTSSRVRAFCCHPAVALTRWGCATSDRERFPVQPDAGAEAAMARPGTRGIALPVAVSPPPADRGR